jgi:23S rRNA pseudouridine2457 synthase
MQQRLTDPRFGHWRQYWVQVEGYANDSQLDQLQLGVMIQGRLTRPAKARVLSDHEKQTISDRNPPIRERRSIPTCWLCLELREGRNRQVRRMTAAVGLPTLRLIRYSIDLMDGDTTLSLKGLSAGMWREVTSAEDQRLQRLLSRSATHRSG